VCGRKKWGEASNLLLAETCERLSSLKTMTALVRRKTLKLHRGNSISTIVWRNCPPDHSEFRPFTTCAESSHPRPDKQQHLPSGPSHVMNLGKVV
jgi:hypothetical protein